jgi:hypothetical protein
MKLRNFLALAALLLLLGVPAFGSRMHKNSRMHHYNHHVKYHGHHVQHNGRAHHKLG